MEPQKGNILKQKRTGTLYRVTRVKPKNLTDETMAWMPYAYYDLEAVETRRTTWTNEFRIDKDYELHENATH